MAQCSFYEMGDKVSGSVGALKKLVWLIHHNHCHPRSLDLFGYLYGFFPLLYGSLLQVLCMTHAAAASLENWAHGKYIFQASCSLEGVLSHWYIKCFKDMVIQEGLKMCLLLYWWYHSMALVVALFFFGSIKWAKLPFISCGTCAMTSIASNTVLSEGRFHWYITVSHCLLSFHGVYGALLAQVKLYQVMLLQGVCYLSLSLVPWVQEQVLLLQRYSARYSAAGCCVVDVSIPRVKMGIMVQCMVPLLVSIWFNACCQDWSVTFSTWWLSLPLLSWSQWSYLWLMDGSWLSTLLLDGPCRHLPCNHTLSWVFVNQ